MGPPTLGMTPLVGRVSAIFDCKIELYCQVWWTFLCEMWPEVMYYKSQLLSLVWIVDTMRIKFSWPYSAAKAWDPFCNKTVDCLSKCYAAFTTIIWPTAVWGLISLSTLPASEKSTMPDYEVGLPWHGKILCHMSCHDMTICHDMRFISEVLIYHCMRRVISDSLP